MAYWEPFWNFPKFIITGTWVIKSEIIGLVFQYWVNTKKHAHSFKSSLLICLHLVVQNISWKSIPTYRESYTYITLSTGICRVHLCPARVILDDSFSVLPKVIILKLQETSFQLFTCLLLFPQLPKISYSYLVGRVCLFFYYVTVSYFNI